MQATQRERTFIMIKPDGVQRGLVGPIISRFETKGFKLVALKFAAPGKEHFEKHYSDLSSKPFFGGLVTYAASGPVVAMVWEGTNVVLTGRKMLGATRPDDSAPGTIEEIMPLMSAETLFTEVIQLIVPTKKLNSGSVKKNHFHILSIQKAGFTKFDSQT
jgi:nucleoside diphosphate kinase